MDLNYTQENNYTTNPTTQATEGILPDYYISFIWRITLLVVFSIFLTLLIVLLCYKKKNSKRGREIKIEQTEELEAQKSLYEIERSIEIANRMNTLRYN